MSISPCDMPMNDFLRWLAANCDVGGNVARELERRAAAWDSVAAVDDAVLPGVWVYEESPGEPNLGRVRVHLPGGRVSWLASIRFNGELMPKTQDLVGRLFAASKVLRDECRRYVDGFHDGEDPDVRGLEIALEKVPGEVS